MTRTYYATPRPWMSALDAMGFTIRCVQLAGLRFVRAYPEGLDCYAVVAEVCDDEK